MEKEMEIDRPDIVAEVRAVFERYERALLANDVDLLNEPFWEDPRATRYRVGENLQGHAAIAAFRRARATGPSRRRLMDVEIPTFGTDFTVANARYDREGHERTGRENKTLVRIGDGWRIVAAHVSLIDTTV